MSRRWTILCCTSLAILMIVQLAILQQLSEQKVPEYNPEHILLIGGKRGGLMGDDGGIVITFTIATPVPSATLIPTSDGPIHFDCPDDVFVSASEYTFLPVSGDLLFIDWPRSMIITDPFSQTTVISGPATVRFQ